jgi:adenosylmethionine-8-amino-7-oxononanoate aminotransferase
MGDMLSKLLIRMIRDHPNVGDIRGRGLFWGIEFVENKQKKKPFPADANIAMSISELALTEKYGLAVYPGNGTVDGAVGDHIILAPAYNVNENDIEFIARTVRRLIWDFFSPSLPDRCIASGKDGHPSPYSVQH